MTTKPNCRKEYWRAYDADRYAKNGDSITLKHALDYYRRKKKNNINWIPGPRAKIRLYCQQHNVDVIAVIEGTQTLPLPSPSQPTLPAATSTE